MSEEMLRVENLKVHFPSGRARLFGARQSVRAVDDVSLAVGPGETVALVGESGCGKSTTGNAILGLAPVSGGRIHYRGEDVTQASAAERARLWREMQVVFQDPVSALNPKRTIGRSIAEPLAIAGMARAECEARVAEVMELVGLNRGQRDRYPNELSGGQRQRMVIARALAPRPRLIVCDEPVSALDVSIQSQILNLLLKLQAELGLSFLFISHDLSVVRHVADRILVMYLGTLVEEGPTDTIFTHPQHPYTEALLAAIPVPDPAAERAKTAVPLTGEIPSPIDPPAGCPFITRCPLAEAGCGEARPPLVSAGEGHRVACFVRERELGIGA